ncbi:hypothetical protein RJZ56_000182 [Blastomyces dermatitidis]
MALQASPADSHDGVSQVTHPAEPEHIPRTPIGDNGKDEEDYNSEEDSDFDVNAPAEEDVEEGEGEEDVDGRTADGGRPSEKKPSDDEEGDDFEIDDDDDVGGEGGQEEQRPLAKADGATVDVDALWEKMKAVEPSPIPPKPSVLTSEEGMPKDGTTVNDFSRQTAPVLPGEETITIKRVYKFAGEVITEEKTVPKDSAEAKLYLSSEAEKKKKKTSSNTKGGDEPNHTSDAVRIPLRRPLRRYSRFDPNPPDMIKKSWEKNTAFPGGAGAAEQPKGPKLNTVMKSKLDWAEYVDRAGIKDDLDVHSKAKEGYLGRMDFLNRVDAKREEERRNARLKNL